MPASDVVVSIVNHENRDLLRDCLASLPVACAGLDWEATVVDNASGDGSLEMLAADFPEIKVIANPVRLGFGANQNQVLRPLLASPDSPRYVLVLNDDTVVEPRSVTAMVAALDADPAAAAVAPTITDTAGRAAASRIAYPSAANAWRADWTEGTEPAHPGGYLQGCCLLLRVAALAEVGPFDERFFLFYEDTDLSRRLAGAGWRLAVCTEAVVVHVGHASVFKPDLAPVTPLQGRRSRYLYFCKYEGKARAEAITAVGRVLLLVRALRSCAGAVLHNPTSGPRARRLFALARQNPRRATGPERAAAEALDPQKRK